MVDFGSREVYDFNARTRSLPKLKDLDRRRPSPADLVLADISCGVGRLLVGSEDLDHADDQ